MIHVSIASLAGGYTVANTAFFRYVLRLSEAGLPMKPADARALDVLTAIPHAFDDDDMISGDGWRVVPPTSLEDWAVLEATPQRLRAALQTARRILWQNAAPAGISAGEVVGVDAEIDNVLGVLQRAEAAGCSVNVSYVS
ncbi:MAG TPA: hypothetical protein VN905_00670 [Candidatus Binatia bacterium]|nr:hypothetical protein [Candidatus Binatia bacterium]